MSLGYPKLNSFSTTPAEFEKISAYIIPREPHHDNYSAPYVSLF